MCLIGTNQPVVVFYHANNQLLLFSFFKKKHILNGNRSKDFVYMLLVKLVYV
jgi:hypothetical protein